MTSNPPAATLRGNSSIEIIVPSSLTPLGHAKVFNCHLYSIQHDRTVKGKVLVMKGERSQSRIQIPREDRPINSLQLYHSFVILQLFLSSSDHFGLEVTVSSSPVVRMKLNVATFHSLAEVTPGPAGMRVAKMPLVVPRNGWVQVIFNVGGIFSYMFDLPPMQWIDSIALVGSCRIFRLLTCSDEAESIAMKPERMQLFAVPAYSQPVWVTAPAPVIPRKGSASLGSPVSAAANQRCSLRPNQKSDSPLVEAASDVTSGATERTAHPRGAVRRGGKPDAEGGHAPHSPECAAAAAVESTASSASPLARVAQTATGQGVASNLDLSAGQPATPRLTQVQCGMGAQPEPAPDDLSSKIEVGGPAVTLVQPALRHDTKNARDISMPYASGSNSPVRDLPSRYRDSGTGEAHDTTASGAGSITQRPIIRTLPPAQPERTYIRIVEDDRTAPLASAWPPRPSSSASPAVPPPSQQLPLRRFGAASPYSSRSVAFGGGRRDWPAGDQLVVCGWDSTDGRNNSPHSEQPSSGKEGYGISPPPPRVVKKRSTASEARVQRLIDSRKRNGSLWGRGKAASAMMKNSDGTAIVGNAASPRGRMTRKQLQLLRHLVTAHTAQRIAMPPSSFPVGDVVAEDGDWEDFQLCEKPQVGYGIGFLGVIRGTAIERDLEVEGARDGSIVVSSAADLLEE